MKRGRGHWCWSCQQPKPNEAFSGRNHGPFRQVHAFFVVHVARGARASCAAARLLSAA
ncbi:MAG TPA: hypothetical protein VF516_11615 [Kofleriaceae bacterium]